VAGVKGKGCGVERQRPYSCGEIGLANDGKEESRRTPALGVVAVLRVAVVPMKKYRLGNAAQLCGTLTEASKGLLACRGSRHDVMRSIDYSGELAVQAKRTADGDEDLGWEIRERQHCATELC
jgi:hypothetical protein